MDGRGKLLAVHDLPNYQSRVGKTNRTIIDIHGLMALLVSCGHAQCFVEKIGARPTDGAAAAFRFGYTAGQIHTALTYLSYPMTLITPTVWRRAMGLMTGSTKDDSRRRASELFPDHTESWARKKDHDRAEAVLIAAYGAQESNL